MPITLAQTDTNSDAALDELCSTMLAGQFYSNGFRKKATSGGTPGTIEVTITHPAAATTLVPFNFYSAENEPNSTVWEAGNWVDVIEVATANKNLTWRRANICRVDATGLEIASVGFVTLAIALAAGVHSSGNISGAVQNAAAGDRIATAPEFENSTSMVQNIGILPSQAITTPVSQGNWPHHRGEYLETQQSESVASSMR